MQQIWVRLGIFLIAASAGAVTITSPGGANSSFYNVSGNAAYNGVGLVSNGSVGCSAFAIDPNTVLTAAHCIGSAPASSVSFSLPFFGSTFNPSSVLVNPLFNNGNFFGGYDIAVLRFGTNVLPSNMNYYPIYTDYANGQDEGSFEFLTVGYGFCGTGTSAATSCSGLHQAVNRYDALYGNEILLADFQDFSNPDVCARSAICAGLDLQATYTDKSLFLGADASKQGVHSFGDSGGPSLINVNNKLYSVGIHSFAACVSGPQTNPSVAPPCVAPDIDTVINSTFGEFTGDTRLLAYTNFIATGTNTPEPATWSLLSVAALAAGLGRKRMLKSLR